MIMATPMPFVIAGAPGAIFWAPLLGLLAGAIVTLVARSLPARGRLVARPVCARCDGDLPWPAVSATARMLGFKRACPTCHGGPMPGDVWLEVGTALAFTVLALRWPAGPTLAVHLAYAALLMVILAIDLRHREVYLLLGYGGVVAALALAPLSMSGAIKNAAFGGAIGAGVFGLIYLVGRVLYRGREPLGSGDITIAALLGAMAGFPGVVTALTYGILAGGISAAFVMLRRQSRHTFIPYGPALCIGGLLALLG